MSLRNQLKRAWDALAYADAGEFLPYAEKCRLLGVEPPAGCRGYLPPLEIAPRRAVALKLSRDLDPHALGYAIDVAQRLEARLVLLDPPGDLPAADLGQRLAALGVAWEEENLATPWVDSAVAFLHRRGDVICLILGAADLEESVLASSPRAARRRAFPTPVVVVDAAPPLPQPA